MGAPTAEQMAALKALFGAVPDSVLLTLDRAFVDNSPGMALVRRMITEERAERSFRDAVFGPVTPFFYPRETGPSFPARFCSSLWSALQARDAELVETAREESRYRRAEDAPPASYDELCLKAALMLRAREPRIVRSGEEAVGDELACFFELAPLARKSVSRLSEWLGRVSEDRTAALKIALRDASAIMDDGAPRLLQVMQAHLPEPQLILRIISVATERTSDRYLADSEMRIFGEKLLEDVERRVERVRTFDPDKPDTAKAVGEDVTQACGVTAEFERSMELTRDGPWGKRVTAARRALAGHVESRLRDIEGVMAKALPMQKVKTVGRMTRQAPCLEADPDPQAVTRARGLFLFLEATRSAAQVGGYGALRNTVAEKLRERLNDYADEVVHHLNTPDAGHEAQARAFLEVAAELLEHADDPKAAQLVRRRGAAAGASQTAKDVA